MVFQRVYEVASVSAPAISLSETIMARSTPIARASRSPSCAWSGPIETAVMAAPSFSFNRMASSMALRQNGLTIEGTPSRMRFKVMGSKRMSVASGICLTQTTICKSLQPFPINSEICLAICLGVFEFRLGESMDYPFSVSRNEITAKKEGLSLFDIRRRSFTRFGSFRGNLRCSSAFRLDNFQSRHVTRDPVTQSLGLGCN